MNDLSVHISSAIAGLLVIERDIFADKRGRFLALHIEGELDGWTEKPLRFREDSASFSSRGVLRGLHGDTTTWKLLQCVAGRVFLAVADLRPGSVTYRKTFHLTLEGERPVQILIPAGCVNGQQCLSDHSIVIYKQSDIYQGAQRQLTISWKDPRLAIPWPVAEPILSARDADAPFLS